MSFLCSFLPTVPLIIAFFVSVAVGLVLGALIYVLFTWMSRRRAGSATITRPATRKSRTSPRKRPVYSHSSSYDRRSNNSVVSAAISFHRQASSPEPFDPNEMKASFKASTFHPLLKCSQIAREAEAGSQSPAPTVTTSTGSAHKAIDVAATPPRPASVWGYSSLKGTHAPQSQTPAYGSFIKAYQETYTWKGKQKKKKETLPGIKNTSEYANVAAGPRRPIWA